jgi:phenylacetaldehyde dehydrogenase
MGPMVSATHRDRVVRYIESGKAEGAELLAGGAAVPGDGYFVRPTVFSNTTGRDLTISREEIFGPVVVAMPFDDLDDVARKANDSRYGLGASIWTNNLTQAYRLIPKVQAGTVWINCHNMVDPNLPFGGYKDSGVGREHGRAMIDIYTETKSVCVAY